MMDKLRVIKFVVAILTFLLIFGLLMVLTILYKQFNKTENIIVENNLLSLEQPQGSSVAQIVSNNGRLHILVKDGGEPDRILILTPDGQKVQQEITLN